MIASYVLRYYIDEDKFKMGSYGKRIFTRITPPFEILTETGVKIWRSKWIALCLAFVSIFLSIYLFNKADEIDKRNVPNASGRDS